MAIYTVIPFRSQPATMSSSFPREYDCLFYERGCDFCWLGHSSQLISLRESECLTVCTEQQGHAPVDREVHDYQSRDSTLVANMDARERNDRRHMGH